MKAKITHIEDLIGKKIACSEWAKDVAWFLVKSVSEKWDLEGVPYYRLDGIDSQGHNNPEDVYTLDSYWIVLDIDEELNKL